MEIAADSPFPAPPTQPDDAPPQKVAWSLRDVLFGAFWFVGLFIAGQVVLVPPLVIFGETSGQLYTTAFLFGAVVEFGIVFVAANFTFRRYGGSWEQLGIRRPSRNTLFWAGAAFAGAMAVTLAYGAIVEFFDIDALRTQCAEQIPREVRDTRALLALASFTVIVVAPPCEEIFFRGFMFPGLKRGWGLAAGIIVSGILFSGAHLLYKSFIPIAGVGMVFAFSYYRSRNLVSTMIAHVAFNSLSIGFIAAGSCDDTAAIALLHRWLA
jgi:CAAX protease family protein